ncbi:MAG: DUF4231 domain-containing protein [Gammaproteobacteria bacterium]|nr:DUF4231 domain-containing protein [Gammaproteobacteria bacterium]
MNAEDTGYARLEDQIAWFDDRSSTHQAVYRRLKIIAIAAAALVPLVSSLEGYAVYAGLLGVVVVVIEGWQHVNQHHENWIRYRATCEHLRHEKYLFLAAAGPYRTGDEASRRRLLADRVEAVLAREGVDWERSRLSVEEPSGLRQADVDAASSQGR